MKKKNQHIINQVAPDSIAEELEIEVGDILLEINGNKIEDIFDYQYYTQDEYIEVLIQKPSGEEWLLEIDKDYDEDLGITFENGLMDDYRSCHNKCIFCFIDQMPKGMRETLYFKDDDSRLSFLQGNYVTLTNMSDEDIELLKTTPASYLGSCRFKLPADLNNNIYNTIFSLFEKYNIMYFLYIGGNDSMDTVAKLSAYAAKINSPVRIIGVPKTIDNDLVHTDHSPGYGSAAKFVASVVRDIALDSGVYKQDSVTIIEIMGRHAGWLTAASALARKFKGDNPILIYLPERAFDVEEFIKSIKNALSYTNNVVICVSEGIKDSSGRFICEYESNVKTDNFGHKMLTGCGKYLEGLVKDRLGIKVRSIELNVTQRCVSSFISEMDTIF